MDPDIPFMFYTMPCLGTAKTREEMRSIMLRYVEVAMYYLNQRGGCTVNAIMNYLEQHCDDEVMQDTVTIYPIMWGALSAGIESKRITISPSGHRYTLGSEVEANVASKVRKLRDERAGTRVARDFNSENGRRAEMTQRKFSTAGQVSDRLRSRAKCIKIKKN